MRLIIQTTVKRGATDYKVDEELCTKALHAMHKIAETLPKLNKYDMTFSWIDRDNRLHPRLQLEQNHAPGKLRKVIIDFAPDYKSATGTINVFTIFTEFEKSNEPEIEFSGHGDNALETTISAINGFLEPAKQTT